jgi:hypothetical protein
MTCSSRQSKHSYCVLGTKEKGENTLGKDENTHSRTRTSKSLPFPWGPCETMHARTRPDSPVASLYAPALQKLGACAHYYVCTYYFVPGLRFFTLICMVLCRPTTVQSFVLVLTSYSYEYSLYPPHGYAHDWHDWSSRTPDHDGDGDGDGDVMAGAQCCSVAGSRVLP